MNAKEYDENYFGSVVPFECVAEDIRGFAKVFSSGSSVLETLLLKCWERGIQTIACGNDCGWRLPAFSVEDEKHVQRRYYKYLNAKGIRKTFMDMNKRRWIPLHYGYISLKADSISNSDEFVRNVSIEMQKHKTDCYFKVKRFEVNGKRGLSFYFDIPRNKNCMYLEMNKMSPDDVLKSTLPSPNAFDIYFNIFIGELERLYPVTQPLPETINSSLDEKGVFCMEKGFDRVGFMEYLENTFSGFENSFLRGTVDNIIDYGLKNQHNSLDQFCYWLSDMLPEVEFKEIVLYMDDVCLTAYGKEQKRLSEEKLEASVKEHPWLDDMIKNALLSKQPEVAPAVKEQEMLKNIMQRLDESIGR